MKKQISQKELLKDIIIITDDISGSDDLVINQKVMSEVIGLVFYARGNVSVNISENSKEKLFEKKTGNVSSFYINPDFSSVIHKISKTSPLKRVTLLITPQKIEELLSMDYEEHYKSFISLLSPAEGFVEGPRTSLQ